MITGTHGNAFLSQRPLRISRHRESSKNGIKVFLFVKEIYVYKKFTGLVLV
jgi:hypothetical protein